MTFTEIVQVVGYILFVVFIFTGLCMMWNGFWTLLKERHGGRDK